MLSSTSSPGFISAVGSTGPEGCAGLLFKSTLGAPGRFAPGLVAQPVFRRATENAVQNAMAPRAALGLVLPGRVHERKNDRRIAESDRMNQLQRTEPKVVTSQ